MGRLVVTTIVFGVLVVGFMNTGLSPFGLWFFMGWFITASMVLKQTWQKVRIDPNEPLGRLTRIANRFPKLGSSISGSVVGLILAVLGVTLAILAYWKFDQVGRFGLLVLGVMTAVSVTLIWLTGV